MLQSWVNLTIVAYIKKLGGTISRAKCDRAKDIVSWAEHSSAFPTRRCISGKRNILAYQLTEWSLLPWVFNAICKDFGHPNVDLFAIRVNTKLPLYMSPFPDPTSWRKDAFKHKLDDLSVYAFFPFVLLRLVLSKLLISRNLTMILIIPL